MNWLIDLLVRLLDLLLKRGSDASSKNKQAIDADGNPKQKQVVDDIARERINRIRKLHRDKTRADRGGRPL